MRGRSGRATEACPDPESRVPPSDTFQGGENVDFEERALDLPGHSLVLKDRAHVLLNHSLDFEERATSLEERALAQQKRVLDLPGHSLVLKDRALVLSSHSLDFEERESY